MTDTSTAAKQPGSLRVGVQRFGTFLSGMIMPNIPALITWGIFTAFFIADGWTPNEALSTIVGPMIHYLLPILVAYQGGRMIYETRGAVVGAIATFGAIAGSDWIIANFNAALPEGEPELGQIHMFIGAMIMGPLAAWIMKKLDALWEGRIKAGFEMLVNMFSAGIFGFIAAVFAFYVLAPIVNWIMDVLSGAVGWLVENGLLPLTSILIEPAKVFFLNNAINHGVLTPLGLAQADQDGKSVLFLLEANPGVGLGLLLAFSVFGVGAARASAPGAALIQFVGGIHEVYFPYVLMKPALLIAVIAGGMSGVFVNVLFGTGLRGPASPGSIIAVLGQTASDSYLGVILAVVVSAAVTFVVASVILRASRKRDLAAEAAGSDGFADAVARTEANKGKKSSVLSGLAGGAAGAAVATRPIEKVIFACDAGMGSSAMGASVLRNKIKQAGISGVSVTNKAIASLDGSADLVITQAQLTDRARQREQGALHVSVDNFMNSPRYDEVVDLLRAQANGETPAANDPVSTGRPVDAAATGASTTATGSVTTTGALGGGPAPAAEDSVLTRGSVRIHAGSATREQALQEAADILASAGAVTGGYFDAMLAREQTVSTYMGNELAIPHGTNEAKDTILGSALSVVRYDGGVDWDGDAVTFVVGIAGKGDEHLRILSNVAELFSDDDQIARLKAARSPEELYELFQSVNGEDR
ncbi:PTS sugar transporter subunit IIA [Microbacterium oryzae]|uniref:Mannitol-specific phosphotransferase enzyme IIA component n=1 Tax=Microbacterium oryzae TaxID=743009 RepID=A0A6I6E4M9_9MICO|nr:PTS mannitol transporter subunit IICBA [Microbacterium oryzae]QGU26278.1 PTS mannitol transporter subunit IICBA [Microbacterium oryzae]